MNTKHLNPPRMYKNKYVHQIIFAINVLIPLLLIVNICIKIKSENLQNDSN